MILSSLYSKYITEIAKSLEIPIFYLNKTFQELIKLNVLEKVKNGKYSLTI